MSVKLISLTPDAESLIARLARVSNPANQDNPDYVKLIRYLIDHQHWSPFEMAHAVVEIETSRAVAAQILRHGSFKFQEFSQRYAEVVERPQLVVGRKQATKNRQSSTDTLSDFDQDTWNEIQDTAYLVCYAAYRDAIELGVAREQARLLLPLAAPTRLYMAGSIRSWIHYCQLRCLPDTQLEHREIAEGCRAILAEQLPTIAEALGWRRDTEAQA